MSEEQIRILNKIADSIENSPITKEVASTNLINAGIITAKGNIRIPYREVFMRKK